MKTYNKKFYREYGYKVTDEPMKGGVKNERQYAAYTHSYGLAQSGSMKGIGIIQKYIDKYPDIPAFKNHLASIYVANNEYAKVKKLQLQILNLHPDYLYGKIIIIEQALKEEDLDMARKMLGEPRKIETISPNTEVYHISEFLTYYCLAGWYELEIDDRDAAEKHLRLMIEVDPDNYRTKFLAEKIVNFGIDLTSKRLDRKKENQILVKSFPTHIVEQTETPPELTHKELEAFYIYSDEDLPEEIMTEIMQLPRESLIADLERILEDSFRRFDYFQKKYKDYYESTEQSFMIHAARFLGALEAKESLPILLNMFRQGEKFSEFWFSDMFSDYFDASLFMLGKDRLDMLKSYMLEPNQYYWAKSLAMGAMTQAALHYPEKRGEVVGYCKEIYEYMLQKPHNDGITDTEFISWSLPHVSELRDTDFAEYVEKFDEKKWIYHMVMGNPEEIIKALALAPEAADIRPLPHDIYEFYNRNYLERRVKHSRFENIEIESDKKVSLYLANVMSETLFGGGLSSGKTNDDDNRYYQEPVVRTEAKLGRNDPCSCGSGKKYKKCCMKKAS